MPSRPGWCTNDITGREPAANCRGWGGEQVKSVPHNRPWGCIGLQERTETCSESAANSVPPPRALDRIWFAVHTSCSWTTHYTYLAYSVHFQPFESLLSGWLSSSLLAHSNNIGRSLARPPPTTRLDSSSVEPFANCLGQTNPRPIPLVRGILRYTGPTTPWFCVDKR